MFKFENQGTNTYLVYEVAQEDNLDTMSLGMLTNNKIPGLASTLFTQMDATKYIKYNVSAKVSVSQFFSGPVNKKRLIGVFSGIVNALLSAEDYMIDINTILLDLNYIFADVSSCESVLICLPILTDKKQIDIGTFFKNIMFSTQFDQTENCDYVAKVINYLNSAPAFSLTNFKILLDEIKNNNLNASIKKTQPSVQSQPVVNQTQSTVNPTSVEKRPPEVKPIYAQPQKVSPTKFNSTAPVTPAVQNKVNKPIQQPVVQTQPIQNAKVSGEKKISMFGLLMHYSKENAELYKAQKAAKKESKQQTVSKNQQTPNKTTATSFAIPGSQRQNAGFAIPGQSIPVQQTVNQSQSQRSMPLQSSDSQKPVTFQQNISQPVSQQYVSQTPAAPQSKTMNFGDTTVLSGGLSGETTVLNAVPQSKQIIVPHLIRMKNNEKIMLNKPVFRIGKERSYVDYFVADNTAVSRSHANIITRDNEYFIVDTNSKNHTYINGNMILSNSEMKITHGDKIRLANEDFEFKLY